LVAAEVLAGLSPFIGYEEDPVLLEHLLEHPEESVGWSGEPADPPGTAWKSLQPRRRCGHIDHVTQIVNARRDEPVVGKMPKRAAVLVAVLYVDNGERAEHRRGLLLFPRQ